MAVQIHVARHENTNSTASLTVDQEISLFQILNTIYADEYHIMSAMGSLQISNSVSSPGQTSTISAVRIWVGNLDSGTRARLITYIDEWDNIGTNVGIMDSGSAGNIGGVSFNWDRKRKLIADRVKALVTFFHKNEVCERESEHSESGGGCGNYIPIVR